MLMGNYRSTWYPLTKRDIQLKNTTLPTLFFNPLAHSSMMIRRQVFKEAGGARLKYRLLPLGDDRSQKVGIVPVATDIAVQTDSWGVNVRK